MHQFHTFSLSWNSTCFGQFACPSSGVYSLYTQQQSNGICHTGCRQLSSRTRMELSLFNVHSATEQWYMSYRFVDSFWAGPGWNSVYKPVWHTPLLSVQWINSWWWTDELSETCRVSWQNKFVKLVHLVGFITKKSRILIITDSSNNNYLHIILHLWGRGKDNIPIVTFLTILSVMAEKRNNPNATSHKNSMNYCVSRAFINCTMLNLNTVMLYIN